jgi:hypothetical protein
MAVLTATSCGTKEQADTVTLTGQALLDPTACASCHAEQFREWSGSMHAYAAEDPVFLAMNARMLRETNGAAGDFCVGCHAPMAVRLGLTKDGSNLASLPAYARGVTCFFCHSADRIEGTHNGPIRLASDDVLRGNLRNPDVVSMPHRGAHSPLLDREQPESSTLCGACHDVVTPHGAHVERTFAEWKASLYAQPGQLSCGKCHMDSRPGVASTTRGAPSRTIHDHAMPAVDIALTPFPEAEAQRTAVQRLLDQTLLAKLCVKQTPLGFAAEVTLDNAFAGHKFPSGANQDRRAWVELIAYQGSSVMFSSGVVADKKAVSKLDDPNLWLLRDRIFRPDGTETHMFWEASRVIEEQLPAAVTADVRDPHFLHSVQRSYRLPAAPDKVTMRVRMRPVDFDLLDDLVASRDLDPSILDRVPTFELGSTRKEWTAAIGYARCVD